MGKHLATVTIAGVVFVLQDERGRVLMEKCPKKAARHGGEWFIPGGRLEDEDRASTSRAMIREMREELGVVPIQAESCPLVDACGGAEYPPFLMRPFLVRRWEGTVPDHVLDHPDVPLRWVPWEEAIASPVRAVRAILSQLPGAAGVAPSPREVQSDAERETRVVRLEEVDRTGDGLANPSDREPVRIFSREHAPWGYWRRSGSGYTDRPEDAGVWAFREAFAQTSHCGPEKGIEFRVLGPSPQTPREATPVAPLTIPSFDEENRVARVAPSPREVQSDAERDENGRLIRACEWCKTPGLYLDVTWGGYPAYFNADGSRHGCPPEP